MTVNLFWQDDPAEPFDTAADVTAAKGAAAAAAARERKTVLIVGAASNETIATMTPARADGFKAAVRKLFDTMEAGDD